MAQEYDESLTSTVCLVLTNGPGRWRVTDLYCLPYIILIAQEDVESLTSTVCLVLD